MESRKPEAYTEFVHADEVRAAAQHIRLDTLRKLPELLGAMADNVLATGGYGNVFYLSTNAMACNVTAAYRAYRKGAYFANPCFTQIHPTCITASDEQQSKLTLMSEALYSRAEVFSLWIASRSWRLVSG